MDFLDLTGCLTDEGAHVIKAGSISCLGDKLRTCKGRVRIDISYRLAGRIAVQNRCQIESETIHVHLADPIAESIHDHEADIQMVRISRVPCTAVVGVPGGVLFENVANTVVQPAEA